MLKNHLLSAFRSIIKNKLHSALNIVGLSIGMAGFLLIVQYVSFEYSYNDFHKNRDNIYRVSYSKEKSGVESFNTVLTYSGTGKLMKQEFPEVIDYTRLRPASLITSSTVLRNGDNFFEEEDVYYADPSFFSIFSFNLVEGDPNNLLKDQFTAVITESMAKKYFGSENPIGKTIKKGNNENFMITGVMEDTPANSHVKISFLLSHATLAATMYESWTEDDLGSFHGHLYLLTQPGINPNTLREKFPEFVMNFIGGEQLAQQDVVLKFTMMSLNDIHLDSHIQHEAEINGDRDIVEYMLIIGILILIIALVNYVNLSTARAMERAKEIGIKKVIGANKKNLVLQYLTESFVVNLFSVVIAILITLSVQPFLAALGAEKLIQSTAFNQPWFWVVVIAMWLLSSLLSGIYPSFVLSSYHPVTVLKGKLSSNRKGVMMRKGLVIFQFISSVSLIIGTMIIYEQISFMRNQKLGMNIEDKLVIKGPTVADSTYNSKFVAFKNKLLEMPSIKGVSSSQSIPGKEFNSATWFTRVDNPEVDAKFCYINVIDPNFANNYEMTFLSGKSFSRTDQTAVLINNAAFKQFEFEDYESAIGKTVTSGDPKNPQSRKWKIVGVIDDFNQQSLKNEISPVIMFNNEFASKFYSLQLNLNNMNQISELIDQIRNQWLLSFPSNPFNYYVLSDGFDAQYKAELEFGRLLSIFSGLAIIVGILGLIGLSTYTIQQRTKEVGIRKALGSSTLNISLLLGKEIFWLIFIANVISWPICWYAFSNWLHGFAFRINMNLWPFMLSFLIISAIASISVGYQIIKASISNPVDALKYE